MKPPTVHLTGALSGVTAAVVGVVLNLALVFGTAVIFPEGFAGTVNWFAAAMSAAAFVALYKFKAEVLWVVLAGADRTWENITVQMKLPFLSVYRVRNIRLA